MEDYFDAYLKSQLDSREAISLVHKFGRNPSLTTSYTPISIGAIYRTPQVSGATKVRVKAGNAADTADGNGAREVTIVGLNASGEEVSETLATAGGSAGPNSTYEYIRLYRAFVSKSGTYASQSGGSHTADVVIENAAGTQDWLTIDVDGFAFGQSEIAAYTVPLGYEAWIPSQHIYVQTTKPVDVVFFQRPGILETAAPYQAMRVIQSYVGMDAASASDHQFTPIGPIAELTDIGYMAKGASTPSISVDFDILLFRSPT